MSGRAASTLALLLLATGWAGPSRAEAPPSGGVFGRAALRGVVAPGVNVLAFAGTAGARPGAPPLASASTGQDGVYRLALPPGTYTLVARGGRAGEPLRTGEPFCFYGGSPVVVREGEWVPVGFNLVRVPAEERRGGTRPAIEGTVFFEGRSQEDLTLTLYRDATALFRGPGAASSPVGEGGRFRVGIPPGEYFLIARKRAGGGRFGPVEMGDTFNYYPRNPVAVGEGEVVRVSLETVARLSQLEEPGSTPRLSGRVVDRSGRPVPGVRVFAFPPGEPQGRPLGFSAPSDERGAFSLDLPRAGLYLLAARQRFGAPLEPGDWRGEYGGGKPLKVEGEGAPSLEIVVERGR